MGYSEEKDGSLFDWVEKKYGVEARELIETLLEY